MRTVTIIRKFETGNYRFEYEGRPPKQGEIVRDSKGRKFRVIAANNKIGLGALVQS